MAFGPPGWNLNQASALITLPSTMKTDLPLAMRSSISALLYTRSSRVGRNASVIDVVLL